MGRAGTTCGDLRVLQYHARVSRPKLVPGAGLGWWLVETRGQSTRPAAGVLRHGLAAGKTAIITTVPHGTDGAASVDLALNRPSLPGFIKVQRIRANLRMPPMV